MPEKKIGTHNGTFHADEVLGCFMLKQLPEYKDAQIIRSRDPNTLAECEVVIDVGGVYCHERRLYDHHQRSFSETLHSITGVAQTLKLSSAGLVYAHYGKAVLQALSRNPLSGQDLDILYPEVYKAFVKEIDAIDNGIDQCNHQLRYRIHTDICSRVRKLNPSQHHNSAVEEEQFKTAMEMVGKEFTDCVVELASIWLPTRKVVEEAIENRYNVDRSGKIIEFIVAGIPWKTHLSLIECEKSILPHILFVIFPDSLAGWRVQAVPKGDGYELRYKILPSCTGLRDEALALECGVPDAVFVHANGFIGGAKSRLGVLKMAQLSLPDK